MNAAPPTPAERLAELRGRERKLVEMLRKMDAKSARLSHARQERAAALATVRVSITRTLLRGSSSAPYHEGV